MVSKTSTKNRRVKHTNKLGSTLKHGAAYLNHPITFNFPKRSKEENGLRSPKATIARTKTLVIKKKYGHQRKLALLLPGHNEELIIQDSIRSAVAAGQSLRDIYVVDDNSDDLTRKKAVEVLGWKSVYTVSRRGKAGAVNAAIRHFKFVERYRWVHIADADSVFGEDYFRIFRRSLTGSDCVVALGFVQSLRGNWISNYRTLSYTFSQHVIRRAQSWMGMISVFPGPITAIKTSIIPELDFLTGTIAEDFDITLQVHRKKLGKVKFIPGAINYTQDPQTLKAFCKQTMRWQRGYFQGMRNYKIGLRLHKIDVSIMYQIFEMGIYLLEIFVVLPIVVYITGKWSLVPLLVVADAFVTSLIIIMTSVTVKRMSVFSAFPYFYFLRWVESAIFVITFVEIFILRKFKTNAIGWETPGRRYALNTSSMKDIAR